MSKSILQRYIITGNYVYVAFINGSSLVYTNNNDKTTILSGNIIILYKMRIITHLSFRDNKICSCTFSNYSNSLYFCFSGYYLYYNLFVFQHNFHEQEVRLYMYIYNKMFYNNSLLARILKLSSPKLNYLIIVGSYWLYINVYFIVFPGRENNPMAYEILCIVSKNITVNNIDFVFIVRLITLFL